MRPLFAILPFLMSAATDAASGGEPPRGGSGGDGPPMDAAEALAKVEDRTLPIMQRLTIAANALKGIDPTNQLAALQEKLTTAQATIAARDTEITTLKADLATVRGELTARQTDVSNLEARNVELETANRDLLAKEQNLETRATAKSKESVKALGFPAKQLPAANAEHGDEKPEDKIRALEGSKRIAAGLYFQEHKKLPPWMN
jgi:chromosome segregation ATPase